MDTFAEPFTPFRAWLDAAVGAGLREPTAMTLATADASGRPSARMVLLRGADERGFTFFTNYRSRKAVEIDANPQGALVWYWADLERQIRAEGAVHRVSEAESDAYFAGRPRDSQLAAWASEQSTVLADRSVLEERFAQAVDRFAGEAVPRPAHWGGYRLSPSVVEFWSARPSRLHDRLRYKRRGDAWAVDRLSP